MSTQILATKLYIPPPRPKVVVRSRLIERLNEGLHGRPGVTLISAPAGFGKTTLVGEWVNQKAEGGRQNASREIIHPSKVAWLSLDERDNDPTRFLAYLIAALQTIAPNVGEEVLSMLHAAQPQPPQTESVLTALLNEITTIPEYFILVLDDYHMLDSRSVDQALVFLVEHLPPQMHLVITSREDPPLPLARLRARGQLTELRAADLRFTPSEAADFLSRVMGLNLSAEDIAALEVRTEGWIAGLQLAALSMQGHASRDAADFIQSFTGAHHFVLDYLLEEVLHRQPENVQVFLLRTSILNRLCGPLCDAVLLSPPGSAFGQETLESLERANLFIVPLDSERRWYRYHHLFGDLLRQRQGQSLTLEEIAKYHIRASEWYEQNGDESEAFQHAIRARDFDRAARLAELAWQGMDESFQSGAWLGWVKQLPEELIRTRPVLCTQIAWAFMDASDVDASEARLRDAERSLEGPLDGMVIVDQEQFRTLPARIAIARAYNAQVRGDLSATIKYGEQALKLAPEEDHFMRAQATVILGSTYWAKGELDAACRSMSDWIDSSQKAGNFIFAIASASGKADILTAQGRLREAERTYQQSLQLASAHEKEAQRIIAHHHLGLALLYHEMGKDESAAGHFQKSIQLGQQSTLPDWPYRKCLAQARLKESEGDPDAALGLLDEAKRLYVSTPIPDTRPVGAIQARLHLRQGQLSRAQEWVREHGLSVEDKLSYLREFEHITLTRVLLAEFQSSREKRSIVNALTLLERLLKAAEAQKRRGSMLEILLVQALAYQARGDTSQASASLERVLTLAQPEGYLRTFVDEGEPMQKMLLAFRSSIEKGSHTGDNELSGYVDKLLSAFAQPVRIPGSDLIEPLSQRELEVLRLIAQGLSNVEISERLFLAMSTVKGHNLRIFGKLQAKSRTEAVARARELGLL
jgi:LuxR family transcriptional regulator, maltose regulon positive regulatory protein